MSYEVHTPPDYSPIPASDSVVFLAGPIQGTHNWQKAAIDIIKSEYISRDSLHLANPRRGRVDQDFVYRDQTRWERHHLFRAARLGVNLFWLAKRDLDLPYEEGRAFGQTTRFEFGMLYALAVARHKPNIVFGVEPGYEGSKNYYLDCADELGLTVHDSLEPLCVDVVNNLVKNRKEPTHGKLLF